MQQCVEIDEETFAGGANKPTEPTLDEIQRAKRGDYERTWKKRLKKGEPTDAERLAWWEESYGLPPKVIVP